MVNHTQSPAGKTSVGWPADVPNFPETTASFPIATHGKPIENEDEWEYEYSKTETETYYVTMDLSHSGMFDKVKDSFQSGNRGGYKQWFNPVYADPNKNSRLRPTKTTAMVFGDLKDDDDKDGEEDFPAPEDDDDDEHEPVPGAQASKDRNSATASKKKGPAQDPADDDIPIDPALRSFGEPSPAASRQPSRAPSRAPSVALRSEPELRKRIKNVGEIQILDLHSTNPVISYKGRIFSGSWASNIGTELMFGVHDELAERDLPFLRTLPGGVDLMAASSLRIVTHPADLLHKTSSQAKQAALEQQPKPNKNMPFAGRLKGPDKYRQLRKETKLEISIAFDKHGRRKPQARFLENLMAIKMQRGEKDLPTTMTRDTEKNYVDKSVDPEEASWQKKRNRDRKRQDRQKAERRAKPKKKRRGGNRWLRPMVTFGEPPQAQAQAQAQGGSEDGSEAVSAATPKSWDELDGGGDTVMQG